MNEDPKGRLDIALLRIAEETCRLVQQRTGFNLWPQAKPMVERIIDDAGIPRAPVDFEATVRKNLGISARGVQ
jgi:hypothetical protein